MADSHPAPLADAESRTCSGASCAGALLRTAHDLFSTLAVAKVGQRLLQRAQRHASAQAVVLYRADEIAGVRVVDSLGDGGLRASAGSPISDRGLIASVVRSREAVLADRVTLDVDPAPVSEAGPRDARLLCVPLDPPDGSPGALALFRTLPAAPFEPQERECMGCVARYAQIALANAQRYEGVMEVARRDPLTGLANHGHFWSTLTAEMSRASRYGRDLSLVMIDVDHFKEYNDSRGHMAGDDALIQVARCIEGRCRASDVAARYGGDEFAAILPETPLVGALSFGEKIRRGVHQLDLRATTGERITVSIGVANYPNDAQSGTDLARLSDEQLYRAKAKGRNCVCGEGYESR